MQQFSVTINKIGIYRHGKVYFCEQLTTVFFTGRCESSKKMYTMFNLMSSMLRCKVSMTTNCPFPRYTGPDITLYHFS